MAKQYNLDYAHKVELSCVWPRESLEFTKWLSADENLSRLGKALDVELELVEAESPVGSFTVDVFAYEVGTRRRVVVLSQLDDTDQAGFGKLVTCAAGKEAEVVVWVVAHALDEHRQAIDWLNRLTGSAFSFYLVELELITIGDSLPAPVFNVVGRPNDWARAAMLHEDLSDTEQVKLAYWTKYVEIAKESPKFMKRFKPHKPTKEHWSTLSCGKSAYHIGLLINTQANKIGIELYVRDNKKIGNKAIKHKGVFEKKLGLPAQPFEGKKASGLRFYKSGCDVKGEPDRWPEFIERQLEWALAMREGIDKVGL